MNRHYFLLTSLVSLLILAACSPTTPQKTTAPEQVASSQLPDTPIPQASDTAPVVSSITPTQILLKSNNPTLDLQVSTTEEQSPTPSTTPAPTATSRPKRPPQYWSTLPIVPEISDTTVEIFRRGLELGNNPNAFSKIGDCGSTPAWFLGDFDLGPEFFDLGDYQHLDPVIQNFQGSFGRTSLAARSRIQCIFSVRHVMGG